MYAALGEANRMGSSLRGERYCGTMLIERLVYSPGINNMQALLAAQCLILTKDMKCSVLPHISDA